MTTAEILERLDGVKATGDGRWQALCPAHDDRLPSLAVAEGDDGRTLLTCHAGCESEQIVAAVSLTMADLFADRSNGDGKKEIVAEYDYTDESGDLLFQVVRFKPKDFRQRRPDGNGGWIWKLGKTRRVLYRLPGVRAAAEAGGKVVAVEGEKDVLALEERGVVATCNPGGAGKWEPQYAESLRGAQVAVIADRDEKGRKHAAEVAASLEGVAASVKVLEPAAGKDVSDHLAAGHALSELVPVAVAAQPPGEGTASSTVRRVELTPASAIRSERVRWLDRGRYPLRGMIVVAGEKGLGKSIYTNAFLPAKLTRGDLDGELRGEPADVLVITAEDSWSSVVKPRLMAHGADLARVHRARVLDGAGRATLTLPDDVPLIAAQLDALRAAGRRVALIVIDPIGAFLAGATDSHKDADVRRALAPLADLAEQRDLAVIVVAHLTKDESRRLISRVSGSGAFVNAARSVLGFARDPDDPDGEKGRKRVLVHIASNWGTYAPSLGMRIESRNVEVDDGSVADVGHLVVEGEIDLGTEDLQRGSDESAADVEGEIAIALKDGRRPSREVKAEVAAELGCSRKTVERAGVRLAEQGKIEIDSGGFPRTTTWALASEDTPVGTLRDTRCVPTEANGSSKPLPNADTASGGDTGVPTEENGSTKPKDRPDSPSRDSRDSLPAREPTEAATEEEETEVERLAAKFGRAS